eukprot:TRINITY_DN5884_c0_g1_i1.p1 TRINITY_DN5884_c0_g1~~TRINITY_DN5884_c0_g1_i1.p1  ORF type:complete len:372 (-),score=85.07 TRINITY_DN5884_c0_g1_i1:121-1236(-)
MLRQFIGSGLVSSVSGRFCVPKKLIECLRWYSKDTASIKNEEDVKRSSVSEYYSDLWEGKKKLQTNCCTEEEKEPQPSSCCCGSRSTLSQQVKTAISKVHDDVLTRSYGCGSPIPPFLTDCTVVDLGSGVGKDSYTASYLVGPNGRAIGIDMTDTALELSRSYIEYHQKAFGYAKPNVEFRKAMIEKTGLPDATADVVMSNCVINLTPDKRIVFSEVFRILKEGGEMFFSDVYSNMPVAEELRKDPTLWGECISGALPFDAFKEMVKEVGFGPIFEVGGYEIKIQNEHLEKLIKDHAPDLKFFSKTMRLIKLPKGCMKMDKVHQKVILKDADEFFLSKDIVFDEMLPKWVEDPNILLALKETRYASHFDFI